MNRRSFLKFLGGAGAAAAVAVVAPEVVKSYFFAPPGGWTLNNGLWHKLNNGLWRKESAFNLAMENVPLVGPNIWYVHPEMFEEMKKRGQLEGFVTGDLCRVAPLTGDLIVRDSGKPLGSPPTLYPMPPIVGNYHYQPRTNSYLGVKRS